MLGFFDLGALGGLDAAISASEAAALGASRRGAPQTGGWEPERLYLPPGKYTKKRKQQAINAVKKLYAAAREQIPDTLQAGLIPARLVIDGRARTRLPPVADVDFAALAQSLETIRVLIAAVEAQRTAEEAKRKKRRAEEEALLMMLAEIL